MTAQTLITRYNHFNGKQLNVSTLRGFHQDVQRFLDSVGHGPYVSDLKGILERSTQALKDAAGYEIIERVELVPIDLNKTTGRVLRVASGYDEKIKVVTKTKKITVRPDNIIAEEVPISSIHTDTKRFQNRQDAFSEASANSVAEHYDPNKFDPIVVWVDKKAKKTFVLSGHSRYEGMKRRKAKAISVRYFKGTEDEAIKFAKVEANRAATQETLIEDLAAYRLMRDGDEARGIKKNSKADLQKIFKGKVQKLEAYSFLAPGGLFVNALSQATTSNYPYLERNAQWIGQLRKENEVLTNSSEDNIFHFFYSDKTGKHLKLSKDEFFKLAKKRINQLAQGEHILFAECSGDGCVKINEKESDPLKGATYKRLREVNETLETINEKLKSTDPKVKVSTQAERDYLIKELAPKLQAEKEKLQAELNIADKQESLFGTTPPAPVEDLRKEVAAINKRITKLLKRAKSRKTNLSEKKKIVEEVEALYAKRDPILDTIIYVTTPKGRNLNGKQYSIDSESGGGKRTKKGKLTKLQKQALQDSIKAGSTPRINQASKSTNKGWTDTPLFEDELKSRQQNLFGGLKGFEDLKNIVHKKIELDEPWKSDFIEMYGDTQIMSWGMPGSGKSVKALKFAQYLAEKQNLKVLYVAREEYGRSTMTKKINENNIGHPNLKVVRDFDQLKKEGGKVEDFDAVFFDSINVLRMSLQDYQDFVAAHPGRIYYPIVQSNKDGSFKGGNDWEHEVDIAGEVIDFEVALTKNRYDPNFRQKAEKLQIESMVKDKKKTIAINDKVKKELAPEPKPQPEPVTV
jgi:hypothetical protein